MTCVSSSSSGVDFSSLDGVPFCLPANYSRLHRPGGRKQQETTGESPQLEVSADIALKEVSGVDDHQRTVTLSVYLTLSWVESR